MYARNLVVESVLQVEEMVQGSMVLNTPTTINIHVTLAKLKEKDNIVAHVMLKVDKLLQECKEKTIVTVKFIAKEKERFHT